MANNAYCDDTPEFALPATVREVERLPARETCLIERRIADPATGKDERKALKAQLEAVPRDPREKSGFAYVIYEVRGAGPTRRVIAFRGTDIEAADWLHGNLGSEQYRLALALWDAEVAAGRKPEAVTGHSLGGALALQVSIDRAGADAHVFNTSPRYVVPAEPNGNIRLAIAERGDILDQLRRRRMPVEEEMLIVNCAPHSSGLADHKIRRLAECLTWIASRDDAVARDSVAANAIAAPPGEALMRAWGRAIPADASNR